MPAYLNSISVVVPPHDVHRKFIDYVTASLSEVRDQKLFRRMAARSQIEHRYSFLEATPLADRLDAAGFYCQGKFPDTGQRMAFYQQHALTLACQAFDGLLATTRAEAITHLIVTSCTGFYAPGLDLQLMEHYGLSPTVERSMVGFMGCNAAINALKLARHIVRSEAEAQVAIVNLELCTLHLQESSAVEQLLSFLLFSDGCAASLVSALPHGIELNSFHSTVLPTSQNYITWQIDNTGFEMFLSGQVPPALLRELPAIMPAVLGNRRQDEITHWAVHPGGRTILDAVEDALQLDEMALAPSRRILRDYGNMSSPTIMFVLRDMLAAGQPGAGCAMAFGPGVTAETMQFTMLAP